VAVDGLGAGVVATLVQPQLLITNTTQNITGDECFASAAAREREDREAFEVTGKLKSSKYDVQQQCECAGDCFF